MPLSQTLQPTGGKLLPAWALALLVVMVPPSFAEGAFPIVEITRCAVWSEQQEGMRHDCSEEARKICSGRAFCELPIGLNLTGGRDLDSDPDTWELVRVDYSCAGKAHINGPHHQNDHATMTLSCGPH